LGVFGRVGGMEWPKYIPGVGTPIIISRQFLAKFLKSSEQFWIVTVSTAPARHQHGLITNNLLVVPIEEHTFQLAAAHLPVTAAGRQRRRCEGRCNCIFCCKHLALTRSGSAVPRASRHT
jgi:hypothetical protein